MQVAEVRFQTVFVTSGSGSARVRFHANEQWKAKPKGEAVADDLASIKERPAQRS